MNQHGQTLILFVILIPLMLGLCAFVIDVSLIVSKSVELKEICKSIMEHSDLFSGKEEMEQMFIENDVPVENLKIEIQGETVHIQNSYYIDSIFGALIGIREYQIKEDLVGIWNEEKEIFE